MDFFYPIVRFFTAGGAFMFPILLTGAIAVAPEPVVELPPEKPKRARTRQAALQPEPEPVAPVAEVSPEKPKRTRTKKVVVAAAEPVVELPPEKPKRTRERKMAVVAPQHEPEPVMELPPEKPKRTRTRKVALVEPVNGVVVETPVLNGVAEPKPKPARSRRTRASA